MLGNLYKRSLVSKSAIYIAQNIPRWINMLFWRLKSWGLNVVTWAMVYLKAMQIMPAIAPTMIEARYIFLFSNFIIQKILKILTFLSGKCLLKNVSFLYCIIINCNQDIADRCLFYNFFSYFL